MLVYQRVYGYPDILHGSCPKPINFHSYVSLLKSRSHFNGAAWVLSLWLCLAFCTLLDLPSSQLVGLAPCWKISKWCRFHKWVASDQKKNTPNGWFFKIYVPGRDVLFQMGFPSLYDSIRWPHMSRHHQKHGGLCRIAQEQQREEHYLRCIHPETQTAWQLDHSQEDFNKFP